jgi:hypothetical protein
MGVRGRRADQAEADWKESKSPPLFVHICPLHFCNLSQRRRKAGLEGRCTGIFSRHEGRVGGVCVGVLSWTPWELTGVSGEYLRLEDFLEGKTFEPGSVGVQCVFVK